jgi:hypothetical protein
MAEVKRMYRLFFRRIGADAWNAGTEFRDEQLTPDARALLEERYARYGLEMNLEKVPDHEGEER